MRLIGTWVCAILLLSIATAPARAGDQPPLSNFESAQVVIGQADFTSGDCNQGGSVAANGLCTPSGNAGASKKLLFIADADNARVLAFKKIPTTNGASAKFVLGQTNFSNTNPGLGAASFGFPSGVEVASNKLFVVDFDNSRVLIWNKLPTKTDTPANVVVGQSGFNSGTAATTQSGLDHAEVGVFVAKGKLFVGDRNNNRIMIWDKVPTTNGAKANVVLGQTDFTSSVGATTQSGLEEPEGIWSDGKRLVVADFFNNRVLIWNHIPTTNGAPADVVVGQPDFTSFDNPDPPTAESLDRPGAVTSDGTSLFVADSGNNRILVYKPFPTANGATATNVLGQADFTHNDANAGSLTPTDQGLSFPFGISLKGNQLIVDDEGNARFLIFGL
jgi:hypothetical protein